MRKTKGCSFLCGLSLGWDPYKPNISRAEASSSLHQPCRHFSLALIRKATNNFHDDFIIGSHTYNTIYKGSIDGGNTMVVIKRYKSGPQFGAHEFSTQINVFSRLRHPHLVSLIGYCDQNDEMIVVYDYMTNGTLYKRLHGTNSDPLPWKQRVEICIGAAKGLHFLHTGGKQTIIHRDVKSPNILLDGQCAAKIANFGVSLKSPSGMPNTAVSDEGVTGTLGYLDPEYARHQQLTEKSDVYSFGVVLFEVLCARKPWDCELNDQYRVTLADGARECIRNRTLDQIIDPYLMGKIAPICLKEFVAIAQSCLLDNRIERPMMGDVVDGLEFTLQLQESADAANEENDSGDDDEPHNEHIDLPRHVIR